MAIRSGFFNGVDKEYLASDLTSMFDGIILEGVLSAIGTAFSPKPGGGTNVNIGIGKAWFNKSYLENTAILIVNMGETDVLLNRYDVIYMEFNESLGVRNNDIFIKHGAPATNPEKPILETSQEIRQIPICYIYRPANSVEILESHIESRIGQTECPFVTGLLQQIDITEILGQWQGQWDDWFAEFEADLLREQEALNQWIASEQADFLSWYQSMKDQLSEDAAGHLQTEIDSILDDGSIGVYDIDPTSTISELKLTGRGLNGKFKLESGIYPENITLTSITINSIVYAVKQGEENEIELYPDSINMFILDEVSQTINFKSGGAGLAITVIAQTERPTSPKENTIWIESDLALNTKTYIIGYERPSAPITGDVYFKLSNTKKVYLYVDKKRQVEVSLSICEYFNGVEWVSLKFETYVDGNWQTGVLYVYVNGNLYNEFVVEVSSTTDGPGWNSYQKLVDWLQLTSFSGGGYSTLRVKTDAINTEGYSKLKIRLDAAISNSSGGKGSVLLYLSSAKTIISNNVTNETYEMDIVQNSNVIKLEVNSVWYNGTTQLKIHEIWFEV